jgi:hypothetical protein
MFVQEWAHTRLVQTIIVPPISACLYSCDSRAENSCSFVFSARSKNFKKSQKKACQPLRRSIKREGDATSMSGKPFKKTLKKVKKKLVSVRKV